MSIPDLISTVVNCLCSSEDLKLKSRQDYSVDVHKLVKDAQPDVQMTNLQTAILDAHHHDFISQEDGITAHAPIPVILNTAIQQTYVGFRHCV